MSTLSQSPAETTSNHLYQTFDQWVERRGSNCTKWGVYGDDVLPLWVADMDFLSPEPVVRALQERVAHGVFGYGTVPTELPKVICARLQRLYGWSVTPDQIVFLPGLVCGLNVVCRAVGNPGDGVLVNSPVYGPFLSAPANQERRLQDAPLVQTVKGPIQHFEMDFAACTAAITPLTRLFLLCNPHNPVGRSFTPAELIQIADFCARHDLVICADEIHADLVLGDTHHTPIAALDPEIAQRTITLMAPSKSFNLPGLGCSMAIVQNPPLRRQLQQAASGIVPHVNVLGYTATLAAYTAGEPWLAALLSYLTDNRDFVVETVTRTMPGVKLTVPEATYLAWLDFRDLLPGNPHRFFLEEAQVALSEGTSFGSTGAGFARLNFGCCRAMLSQALEQMGTALRRRA